MSSTTDIELMSLRDYDEPPPPPEVNRTSLRAWALVPVFTTSIVWAAVLAPRVAIYTDMVCAQHRPPHTTGNPGSCASDPVVQEGVATLTVVMSLLLGVCTILTTTFWGSYSDRHGRTRVLSIALIGAIINDSILLSFAYFWPRNYWLITIGPVIEGALGGLAVVWSTNQVFLTDVSPPSTRSASLSLMFGCMTAGLAIGPTLASLAMRATGTPLSVFCFSLASNAAYLFINYGFSPEPRTKAEMQAAKDIQMGRSKSSLFASVHSWLEMFRPSVQPGTKTRNWDLIFAVICYGCSGLFSGMNTYKFQYLTATLGWTSEVIGYGLTCHYIIRATFLLLLIPALLKLAYSRLPVPLGENQFISEHSTEDLKSGRRDVYLARVCCSMEATSYLGITLFTSQTGFIASHVLNALSCGYIPAIQSIVLALYQRNGGIETGGLFGALAVLDSLSMLIVGPTIFGFTYVKTVESFPQAIFVVAGMCSMSMVIALLLVRFKEEKSVDDEEESLLPSL